MGTSHFYAEHDGGHLNSRYDDGVAIAIAETPVHELYELPGGYTLDRKSSTVARDEESYSKKRLRYGSGSLFHNVQSGSWYLTWRDKNGKRQHKTLVGSFANEEEAWQGVLAQQHVTAAELRAEREAIAADIVKAKREESERTVEALFTAEERKPRTKHFRIVADTVLGIYLDRRHALASCGNLRGVRFTDASRSHGNYAFQQATVLDFLSDVEITARSVLKLPLHIALWRLLYIEARFPVERAMKRYADTLRDMHIILGREFERRVIYPTYEYFRPFKAPKPKWLRQSQKATS